MTGLREGSLSLSRERERERERERKVMSNGD